MWRLQTAADLMYMSGEDQTICIYEMAQCLPDIFQSSMVQPACSRFTHQLHWDMRCLA